MEGAIHKLLSSNRRQVSKEEQQLNLQSAVSFPLRLLSKPLSAVLTETGRETGRCCPWCYHHRSYFSWSALAELQLTVSRLLFVPPHRSPAERSPSAVLTLLL
ncbi:hypothetical protein EYF80_004534 [Liparis tanakae]|uniref:Uncharacterized protein n=1 Tax=Liparis tanakae TaxID=230148 RepID=A0A4Z2J5N8_9TELE|nr:hypothetical protein EYF80_004534 [Liparis tanakae]